MIGATADPPRRSAAPGGVVHVRRAGLPQAEMRPSVCRTTVSHLATAVGVAGITQHGKRVRLYLTVDVVNALEQEKA